MLALFAVLSALVAVSGCGFESSVEESEGERPSAETIDELRENSVYNTIYWLGDEFAGMEISGAELSAEGAWVSYGKRYCDPGSGCGAFPIQISSTPGWPSPYLPPAARRYTCFERIRGAVLIEDCRNPRHPANQWGTLHAGPSPLDAKSAGANSNFVTLSIGGPIGGDQDIGIADLARRIYPIDSPSGRLKSIPPPEPVPCPRLEYLVRWWIVANRKAMGSNPHCDVRELLGL